MARIAFLYNAQIHHILHSLPIACELSRLFPEHDVAAIAPEASLPLIGRYAALYPGNRVQVHALRAAPLAVLGKVGRLFANRTMLDAFDAIVVPERTSLILRRLGVRRPRLIHAFHGSSGHDRVDDPRLRQFDLLLAPTEHRLERIREAGALRDGRAAVVGYSKLDLVERLAAERAPLFDNGRPTVLYNPHHWQHMSSWPVMGPQVLDWFAGQDRYNLVFAPHIRLFDGKRIELGRWRGVPHMLLDLGSEASIDMRYTLGSDIYLGDVSSQVFEFIRRPRPCLFLDPRGLCEEGNPDFASWTLGPVVRTVEEMACRLASCADWQPRFAGIQVETAAQAFPWVEPSAPIRAATALDLFLRDGALGPAWQQLPPPPKPASARARVRRHLQPV